MFTWLTDKFVDFLVWCCILPARDGVPSKLVDPNIRPGERDESPWR
jgi:hypothetical protein